MVIFLKRINLAPFNPTVKLLVTLALKVSILEAALPTPPSKVIELVLDALGIAGIITCSLKVPVTVNLIGPETPPHVFNAAIALANVVKFVGEAAMVLLMV
jgi:hypothetical protein